jgi:hypothetical protein
MSVTFEQFLACFQKDRPKNLIITAIEEDIPPLALLGKVLRECFGPLSDGELATAGKAVRVVAESLGHRHLQYGIPFKVPGSQHRSGSMYAA